MFPIESGYIGISLVIFLFVIIYKIIKKEKRMIRYGKYRGGKIFIVNGRKYILEEAEFKDYHKAIHHYYKVVDDTAKWGKILEVKYDLYDWGFSIYRLRDATVKIIVAAEKVYLIKSDAPVSIQDIEYDSNEFT